MRHAERLPDKKPFTIGLEPLDPARWFEPDNNLLRDLAQKEQLFTARRSEIFQAQIDTLNSQKECWRAIADFLCAHDPAIYRRDGEYIAVHGNRIGCDDEAPLLSAARLVQDDLCLMRASPEGWRLVAAALCFPSTWLLREKFGLPMGAIHTPVPGFAGQMERRVQRIFDALQPAAPVWRMNWSIYEDAHLRHARARSAPRRWPREGVDPEKNAFLRIERQTLTKMPISRDILFTIRIYSDPLAALARMPECAAALRTQLLAMDEQQLAYKNLLRERDMLAAALAPLAG